ncbi:hypothetical protein PMAYCL1PPCAC_07266, partial [Pristionchus mayeri]
MITSILIVIWMDSTIAFLPPAPYHFQLRCLSGQSSPSLSTCNSSSTACAFFSSHNHESEGQYTCVDESFFERNHADSQSYLLSTCGPTPGCSLLPPFSLTNDTYRRLSLINSKPTKFCCSLFYNTLVKLVEDPSFQPKEPSLITCAGMDCDTGAVGCLVYAETRENVKEWEEKRKRKRHTWDGVKAIEVSFGSDEEEAEKMERKEIGKNEKEEEEDFGEEEEYSTEIVEYEEDDDPVEASTKCVYRHLQDELYKYCLLVHSKNEPLKCTSHLGFTLCCCFVFPGASTCDPTRVQRPKSLPTPPLRPPSSLPPSTASTPSTTTFTITTTTSSSTTTSTSIPSTTTSPPSTTTTSPISTCDVEYVKQLGGKTKMRVVCSSPSSPFFPSLITLSISYL